jgi:hypothetical protein
MTTEHSPGLTDAMVADMDDTSDFMHPNPFLAADDKPEHPIEAELKVRMPMEPFHARAGA